ncbi:hypothetical protein E6H20_05170 [Candidatus Bathyarchaeota archaeon]|nr:MAG: hypothetical protein E6H20_05170 [Candidatus Bathyarchaeota archaeon]
MSKPRLLKSGTSHLSPIIIIHPWDSWTRGRFVFVIRKGVTVSIPGGLQNGYVVNHRAAGVAQMKTINTEETVVRSHFIDCPSCKTHTLKLKRVVQVGRCKSCHESYKIAIVYVKEGKKTRAPAKPLTANTAVSPDATLPSWQVPSDSSLFGPSSSENNSIFSDFSSSVTQEDQNRETSTGSEQ